MSDEKKINDEENNNVNMNAENDEELLEEKKSDGDTPAGEQQKDDSAKAEISYNDNKTESDMPFESIQGTFDNKSNDSGEEKKKNKKKTQVSLPVFIAAIVAVIALCFTTAYQICGKQFDKKLNDYILSIDNGNNLSTMSDINKYITIVDEIFKSQSYYEFDEEDVLAALLKGYADGTGDKYAEYYTQKEYEDMNAEDSGEMVGIGVNVIYNLDYKMIEIINILPDSPALESNLQIGDLIAYVGIGENKISVTEMTYEAAVAAIKGEAGTFAEFTVIRGENYSETVELRIERRKVITQSVMYHVCATDAEVGIVKITGFDLTTPSQFCNAIDTLKAGGCNKFVLDVRYNPGGYLISVEAVLSYFLNENDPIIYTVNAKGDKSVSVARAVNYNAPYDSCNVSAQDIGKYKDLDIVVLANNSTASAGELFTATLQQYGLAKFVGTTTYGKGSMQTTYSLSNFGLKGAVKMTTNLYFPKDEKSYDGIGITPDYEVMLAEELQNKSIYKITDAEDNQLQYGIDVMYNRNK